eukprot:6457791-Pyramimonas_sp.AAC.1
MALPQPPSALLGPAPSCLLPCGERAMAQPWHDPLVVVVPARGDGRVSSLRGIAPHHSAVVQLALRVVRVLAPGSLSGCAQINS